MRERYFGQNLYIILLLSVIICLISGHISAFSGPVRQFIEDGKQIRLQVQKGLTEISLTTLQDLEILRPGSEQHFFLQNGQGYIIKPLEGTNDWLTIQVLAVNSRKEALQARERLSQQGFTTARLVEEHGLFKVRLGYYHLREEAAAEAERLGRLGWQTWIMRDREETDIDSGAVKGPSVLAVLNRSGELLFYGRALIITGEIKLGDELYSGRTDMLLSNQGISMYNTVGLADLVSVLLGSDNSDNQDNSALLKAGAVMIRTALIHRVFTRGEGFFIPGYHGLAAASAKARQAVAATTGQVLEDNGQPAAITLARAGSPLPTGYQDYRQLLQASFPGCQLVDLSLMSEEKVMVDTTVKWGLKYLEIRQFTWWGPRVLTILELGKEGFDYRVRPVLAGGQLAGLDDLAAMVKNNGALAGVNGGYYSYTGRPLGLLMIDGKMVSEPIKGRTALGITADNQFLISRVEWQGLFSAGPEGESVRITGVNRRPSTDEVVIINSFYGERAPRVKAGITQLVVSSRKIISRQTESADQSTPIPENGYIIQAHGQARSLLAEFQVGETVIYRDDFKPNWKAEGVVAALGAGPGLIKDGRIEITSQQEEFQADITRGRAPRSAVGITADGHLVLFTVDGRQPGFSIGISLEELARYMLDYGVVDGMNLDGGASSRMVVRGYTMNNPSDQRLISNSLLIWQVKQ